MDKPVSREELRQRLKNKIKGKRGGGDNSSSLSAKIKADPASAMLALGLDDPDILKNARDIVRNPHNFLKSAVEKAHSVTEQRSVNKDEIEDDEEAPPP